MTKSGYVRRLAVAMAFVATAALLHGCRSSPASIDSPDLLAEYFLDPPPEARPRVWWHWLNGNVTKDGIRKDIEWMSRVGIGGIQNFDADLDTPLVVERRAAFMSPDWKDAFRYAVEQADSKGLEYAIAASPGWSLTGGPWVPPEDGMKKLVWSETVLRGGERFTGKLPAPPDTTGPFHDIVVSPPILGSADPNPPRYYADAAVLAYPLSEGGQAGHPSRVLMAGEQIDASVILDGSLHTELSIPRGDAANPAALVFEYDEPVRIQSASLALAPAFTVFGAFVPDVLPVLEVEAGGRWEKVANLTTGGAPQSTTSFPAVTGQRFRIVFTPSGINWGQMPPSPIGAESFFFFEMSSPTELGVRQVRLSGEALINRFELKAGFGISGEYHRLDEDIPDEHGVPASAVIDLTDRVTGDGDLDWVPPEGSWKVLRLGYSLTGVKNHPAAREATGLEVDKLDSAAVRRYLETYIEMYRDAAGADLLGRRGLNALLTDSIETGPANWTPRILDEFENLRGYDPRPWLPALTGVIVGSRTQSNGFLYDFRRTLIELMSSAHYGTVAEVAHEHGLTVYGESLEGSLFAMGEDLSMRRYADIPMAAMWTFPPEAGPSLAHVGDIRGAASVANIYGRRFVAVEALTSQFAPWAFAPRDLKPVIDALFVSGANRPVIHTSVHQPLDDFQPGLSLWVFGQYFNRHETWAEMARPWIDYIARTSFLLQQGRTVSDIAYFVGEGRPSAVLMQAGAMQNLPVGYGYDLVNADALITQLSVEGDEIVAKGGARYRAIYLGGDSQQMTLPVLRRLAALAASGATLIGPAPAESPSLADDKTEFDALVARLWSGAAETTVGLGRVIASAELDPALEMMGIRPDFSYDRQGIGQDIHFLHRRLPEAEIYFLTNGSKTPVSFEGRFRVAGKKPEIWRAETGAAEPVSYRFEGDETIISLDMFPEDAFFVVFRHYTDTASFTVIQNEWTDARLLDGEWDVMFQPDRGAPASAHFPVLSPLNESEDAGIRYFSGIATYRSTFESPAPEPGQRAMLDLGEVCDVAEVYINGEFAGTLWRTPNEVDISELLRAGRNEIEVRVANLWANRIIGDRQPGAEQFTHTAAPTYLPEAPLRRSGLIGPVVLKMSSRD